MRQPQPGVGRPGFIRILTGVVAVIALAACGGSTRSGNVNDPNKTAVAFNACMSRIVGPLPSGTPDPATIAKLQTASKQCQTETGHQSPFQNLTDDQKKAMLDQALKFAACMRQHGVDMPDPQLTDKRITIPQSASSNFDPNSPAFGAAARAYESELPKPPGAPPGGGATPGN
jgi:hypothetical protein